jgi:esterase/lipase superfamily enzyme
MAHARGTVSILISVTGATKEPLVSAVTFRGSEAVDLPASVTRSQRQGGIEFAIRLNAPARSDGIFVKGEFEFTDASIVKVSIRNEASPSTAARNLSIAVAGGTATFETFQPVEATLQPTITSGLRGVRPTTPGSIDDLLAGDAAPGKTAVARKLDPPQDVDYEVWFGTDRGVGVPDGAGVTFTAHRGRALTLGTCKVRIPPSHKIGSTGSGLLKRLFGPDDRLKLVETRVSELDAWSDAIRARLASLGSTPGCGVVFVHGYNVSFRDAAIRSAQLGYDLAVDGPMAFFSWPSRGAIASYAADEATVDASEDHLFAFLRHFIAACGGAPVHVIAHSMGNRVVARTLVRLRREQPDVRLDQLISAAPDLDQDTFASLARQFRDVAKQATLYISANDTAVELSRVFHSEPRAGLYPPVTVLPGFDTVAVTDVDTSLLGHGYVAEAREVLHDMHSVLHFGMTPDKRMGLRLMAMGGSNYWAIVA